MTATKPTTLQFIRGTLIWFLLFYGLFALFTYLRGGPAETPTTTADLVITPQKTKVTEGGIMTWTLEPKTALTIPETCDKTGVQLLQQQGAKMVNLLENLDCGAIPKPYVAALPGGEKALFSLGIMQHEVITEPGEYILTVGEYEAPPVEMRTRGPIRQLFRAIITRPLFNLLAWFTSILPGHSYGWAVVLLTLLVRLLLFIPNQRALKAQKRMQAVQPKLQELQKKYKGDRQKLAMKTMELYKAHQVNPMSSCLPMLLQIPFLFGLYYLVQDGLSPHLSPLLYSFFEGINLDIAQPDFFGLNLNERNLFPLPVLVAVAQFFTFKLTFSKTQTQPSGGDKNPMAQAQQMQKIMLYVMPIMIGFFTATLPSAVGIYWLTSTIFGGLQHLYVHHQLSAPEATIKL